MSTITNPQNNRTIYIGAFVGLVIIATIAAILRLMFVRRMRRRLNAPLIRTVVPPYPRNSNIYPGYQPPYVPPPVHPYPTPRPYNDRYYPDYPNPYASPYVPPFPSPPSPPVDPIVPSPRVKRPKLPPNNQDGRASRDPTVQPTDGRNPPPRNNTMPSDGLGPPPAYEQDGRDG